MTDLEIAAWAVVRAWKTASKIDRTERSRLRMDDAVRHLATVSGYREPRTNRRLLGIR